MFFHLLIKLKMENNVSLRFDIINGKVSNIFYLIKDGFIKKITLVDKKYKHILYHLVYFLDSYSPDMGFEITAFAIIGAIDSLMMGNLISLPQNWEINSRMMDDNNKMITFECYLSDENYRNLIELSPQEEGDEDD